MFNPKHPFISLITKLSSYYIITKEVIHHPPRVLITPAAPPSPLVSPCAAACAACAVSRSARAWVCGGVWRAVSTA